MSNQKEAGTVASPAAESVDGHEYLLEEILELLPAKSMGRFKLISKRWLSLISDHFRRRSTSKSPIGMFLCHVPSNHTKFVPFNATLHKTRIPSLEFLKNRRININNLDYNVEICQSCNGLLLCLVVTDNPVPTLSHRKLKYYDFVVCNPTTEQFRLLPRAACLTDITSEGVLAFDPSVSIHYKLICARNQYIGREYFAVITANYNVLDIYSSEDNSWRDFTSPYSLWGSSRGDYLKGSVYWDLYQRERGEEEYYYLRFDVNSEKMTQIRACPLGPEKYFCEYFSEVSGASMWCAIEHKCSVEDYHILELKIDSLGSCKWVTKNDVCVSTLLRAYPQIASATEGEWKMANAQGLHYDTLCVVEGRKEEESALVLAIPGKVISYNFIHKTVKEHCDLQAGYRGFNAFPFTESFYAV